MQHVINQTNQIDKNPGDKFTWSVNVRSLFKEVSSEKEKKPPFYAKQCDKWGFLLWIMAQLELFNVMGIQNLYITLSLDRKNHQKLQIQLCRIA